MENYHCHSFMSNITTSRDSTTSLEKYAERTIAVGGKTLSSLEHGFQGNWLKTYDVAQKFGLQTTIGCEAYWVKDNQEKDRTNCHIVLLCCSETGRRALNGILSDANEFGYYYRARLGIKEILSLPPQDIFCTSACVAGWLYEDADDIWIQIANHFGKNFMFEVQNHNTPKQIELNKHILDLSLKYNIPIISALDSHFINPEDSIERDDLLADQNIHYDDESGWLMDFPDEETVKQRFVEQGVFSEEQIQQAINNSDIVLSFEDFQFDKKLKLPTIYPGLSQKEKDSIFSKLISKKYKEFIKGIPEEEHQKYFDGVKEEVQTYKDTGISDYPLIDYAIVKRAKELGGQITLTGRGSACSFLTNTLCGFSTIDRFKSPIKLYPERFITTTRILESGQCADIDMNVGNVEVFEQAQSEVLGKDKVAPMIALGTLKKRSAFKMYARVKKLEFDIANEISKQIGKYDEALKYADDEEREEINIFDYVDKKYHEYIEQSKPYWGIVVDKKKHPCGYLLCTENIREAIGLIKCKSDTTKKEYLTTVIDGAMADKYGYIKNDLLVVTVVSLIYKIFERIGENPISTSELIKRTENDENVWRLYANGFTIGINQFEKQSTTQKTIAYKPKNISELSAMVAAIRPGFRSLYKSFESRQPFEYGIKALDDLIQTEQFKHSYVLYQENLMAILNYSGFPMQKCYDIIKQIAKKKPQLVKPLKEQFLKGFQKKLIEDENVVKDVAEELSDRVWTIIDDSTQYSFNSSHAYSVALDGLYCAYLKSSYPFEFYEVLLQVYSSKGQKDKVTALKKEMAEAFGIQEGKYKWGADNRKFVASPENHCIYPSLLSIKGLSQGCANDLYRLAQEHKNIDFYQLWKEMKAVRSLNSGKIEILIKIGYFEDFGSVTKLEKFMQAIEVLYERTQFKKADVPDEYRTIIQKYSDTTDQLKVYRNFNFEAALEEVWNTLKEEKLPLNKRLKYELDYLGYPQTIRPNLGEEYAFVEGYECKFKNPVITLYRIKTGESETVKVKRDKYDSNPFQVGDIIKTVECSKEGKWKKTKEGWLQLDEKETILQVWVSVK